MKETNKQKLSESRKTKNYLKKLRKRDSILGDYKETNCTQVGMNTKTEW